MTDDHTGLMNKYIILTYCPLGSDEIVQGGYRMKMTWSFVLSPEKDDAYGNASRIAMRAYAEAIRAKNPTLADDLLRKVEQIERRSAACTRT